AGAPARRRAVTDLVADERDASTVQIGDENLPALPRDLDDVALGVHVMATMRLTLVREGAELACAVLVEQGASEDALDECPGRGGERLPPGVDGARPVRVLAGRGKQIGDDLERLGVAREQRRTLPSDPVGVARGQG